jgi:hypothetical protein
MAGGDIGQPFRSDQIRGPASSRSLIDSFKQSLAMGYRSGYSHPVKYTFPVVFLVVAASSAASAFPQQEAQPRRPEAAYDCTKLPYASAGCQSYDEMLAKEDKDILGLVNGSHVFACFKPDEDVFFVVSLIEPYPSEYTARSGTSPNNLQSTGIFSYARFKNGMQEDANTLTGLWRKFKPTNATTFSAKDDQNTTHAAANDTEISFDHSFRSLNKTRTVYALQIRRSTLRFSETYTASEVPPNSKQSTKPTEPKTKAQAQTGSAGYCAEFNGH